ncbi:hypothetical protein J6590_048077 [Homalodisca vitripennis]|nr:hypothetical protein J6590_048077 [Homalodisca vitripennis]
MHGYVPIALITLGWREREREREREGGGGEGVGVVGGEDEGVGGVGGSLSEAVATPVIMELCTLKGFDWRGWNRSGLLFFLGDMTDTSCYYSSWILTGGGLYPEPYPS